MACTAAYHQEGDHNVMASLFAVLALCSMTLNIRCTHEADIGSQQPFGQSRILPNAVNPE